MTTLAQVSQTVAVPVEAIWAVLIDFGRPQRLAPSILRCETTGSGVGAVRTVHSSRGLTIREELVECDAAAHRFRYRILGDGDMPFAGVTRYDCTVTLRPAPGGTEVTWRSEGEVDGPLEPVTAFLEALYRGAIANIARICSEP